jgi:hypothetical protein
LPSKFAKSAKKIQKFWYKKAEFSADFKSIEKLQKMTAKKVINKKMTEKWCFFAFITVCKSFHLVTSIGGLFCTFFNGFEISIKFCVYDTFIKYLKK